MSGISNQELLAYTQRLEAEVRELRSEVEAEEKAETLKKAGATQHSGLNYWRTQATLARAAIAKLEAQLEEKTEWLTKCEAALADGDRPVKPTTLKYRRLCVKLAEKEEALKEYQRQLLARAEAARAAEAAKADQKRRLEQELAQWRAEETAPAPTPAPQPATAAETLLRADATAKWNELDAELRRLVPNYDEAKETMLEDTNCQEVWYHHKRWEAFQRQWAECDSADFRTFAAQSLLDGTKEALATLSPKPKVFKLVKKTVKSAAS